MRSSEDRAEESFLSDDMIRELFEEKRKSLEAGNKYALFEAICLVLRFQTNGPEWVTDHMLEVEKGIKSGKYADPNEAFGWTSRYRTTRRIRQRQAKHKSKILAMLMEYRLAGGSMNAEEAFRPIAVKLGIPWRDVDAVYKRDGNFIKALPQGNLENINYGFGDCVLPLGRRFGGSIFDDNDK